MTALEAVYTRAFLLALAAYRAVAGTLCRPGHHIWACRAARRIAPASTQPLWGPYENREGP